jgi:anti-sigma-K factor RskA
MLHEAHAFLKEQRHKAEKKPERFTAKPMRRAKANSSQQRQPPQQQQRAATPQRNSSRESSRSQRKAQAATATTATAAAAAARAATNWFSSEPGNTQKHKDKSKSWYEQITKFNKTRSYYCANKDMGTTRLLATRGYCTLKW